MTSLEALLTGLRTFNDKKKAKSQKLAGRLVANAFTKTKTPKQSRPSTPTLIAIKLI